MAVKKTRAIASNYDLHEDWDTGFAWALPEGHVLVEDPRTVNDEDPSYYEDLKRYEYVVELVHAPEAEALAYFCERAGAVFIPAKEAA